MGVLKRQGWSRKFNNEVIEGWSGRVDSNHRPPGPEPTYINNLQPSFTENKRVVRLLFGPYLDPKGEALANRTAVGPCLDPDFHAGIPIAFAHARGRVAIPKT